MRQVQGGEAASDEAPADQATRPAPLGMGAAMGIGAGAVLESGRRR